MSTVIDLHDEDQRDEVTICESSSLLPSPPDASTQQHRVEPSYESISLKLKKTTNNFIAKSIVYTLMVAAAISVLCVAVVYTTKLPDDNPIEMIEEKGTESSPAAKPGKMFNNNVFDPHEQGDDDYTSDYYPYYHQFVGKTLYMDGKYKEITPRQGYNYHIEFFKEAGFAYWDTYNYFPRLNIVKIGEFAGSDEDAHVVTGNHELAHKIYLKGGSSCDKTGANVTRNEGTIHMIWGEETKLVDVREPEPCVYVLIVSSPDDQTFIPTSSPTAIPTANPTMKLAAVAKDKMVLSEKHTILDKKTSLRDVHGMQMEGITDGKNCVEGYFIGNEWHCKDEKTSGKGNKDQEQEQEQHQTSEKGEKK